MQRNGQTRLWRVWLVVGVLFSAVQPFTSATGELGRSMTAVLPLLFTAGLVTGVLMHRPRLMWPWLMLATAGPVTMVGYALWGLGHANLAFWIFFSAYPLQAAALLLIVRGTSWWRDRAGMLDTAMICTGLALAYWLLVITPLTRQPNSMLGSLFSVLFPLGDVLLLGVLIRFFTSRGLRNAAFWQMSASLLLQTLSHMVTMLATGLGWHIPDVRPINVLGALLLAGAALHPSMRALTGQPVPAATEISLRRILLVNVACIAAPALQIVQAMLQHGRVAWIPAAIGSSLLFVLLAMRMVDLVRQVQDKARQLEAVAHIDALTALPNRRAWDRELAARIAAAARHGEHVVVAIADLDHFKRYNDTYGHQGGDELLTGAAAAWRSQLRPEDVLARYGGEEFAMVFSHSKLADADTIIERLQERTPLGQTFSAGAAQWNGTESPEELLARADAALYAAKRSGRNRVYVAGC